MRIVSNLKKTERKYLPPYICFYTWDIHYACNYRCKYCYYFSDKHSPSQNKDRYIPASEWIHIWRGIYTRYGAGHLHISGGEPFIYPGIEEIISGLKDYFSFEFDTNLSFDANEFIKKVKPGKVRFCATYHPEFTDFQGFLNRALKLKHAGFDLTISFVAHPEHYDEMQRVHSILGTLNMALNVIPFRGIYKGQQYPHSYTDTELALISTCGSMHTMKNYEFYSDNSQVFHDKQAVNVNNAGIFVDNNLSLPTAAPLGGDSPRPTNEIARIEPPDTMPAEEAIRPEEEHSACVLSGQTYEQDSDTASLTFNEMFSNDESENYEYGDALDEAVTNTDMGSEKAPENKNYGKICRMGYFYTKIHPDGNAYRCCIGTDDGYLGNIIDRTFSFYEVPKICRLPKCTCWVAIIPEEESTWGGHWKPFKDKEDTLKQNRKVPSESKLLAYKKKLTRALELLHNKKDDAKTMLKELIDEKPKDVEPYIMLGGIFMDEKKYDLAEPLVNAAFSLSSENMEAAFMKAELENINKNYNDAIKYYNIAVDNSSWNKVMKAKALAGLGEAYFALNDYMNAIVFLKKALKTIPGNIIFRKRLYFIQLFAESLQNGWIRDSAKHIILARQFASAGANTFAVMILERVIALEPANREALILLAERYMVLREHDKAKSCLENALKLSKTDPWVLRNMAQLYMDLNNLRDAERFYMEAIKNDTGEKVDAAYAFFGLSELYLKKNAIANALGAIQQACDYQPSNGLFLQRLTELRSR